MQNSSKNVIIALHIVHIVSTAPMETFRITFLILHNRSYDLWASHNIYVCREVIHFRILLQGSLHIHLNRKHIPAINFRLLFIFFCLPFQVILFEIFIVILVFNLYSSFGILLTVFYHQNRLNHGLYMYIQNIFYICKLRVP